MSRETLKRVAGLLRAIPGVKAVATLDHVQKQKVVELESTHEKDLPLPCRNLGVSLMGERHSCFVLLKTEAFRPPLAPSLYMVEESGDSMSNNVINVAGKRYTVVGEEVTEDIDKYSEPVIPLERSFVMFPKRRSNPQAPCFFLLPPLPFPELEAVAGELGLREIISISPSIASDAYLREAFGFPSSNSLATLLVGFDLRSP